MDLESAFGTVLRKLRNEKGFSQEVLANMSGLHRTYLSLLERGVKTPTLETLKRISKALDIPMHQFVLLVEQELTNNADAQPGESYEVHP